MKTLPLLCVLTLVCSLTTGHAQEVKTYKARVTLMDKTVVKGTCYAANEDAFVILGKDLQIIQLVSTNMEAVKLKRQDNARKKVWAGAITGATLGVAIGLASIPQDAYFSKGAAALIGGVIGAPAGALIIPGLYAEREKFLVHGDKDRYLTLLPKLQQYAPHKSINL